MIVRIAGMEDELTLHQAEVGVVEFESSRLFSKVVSQVYARNQKQAVDEQQIIIIGNDGENVQLEEQLMLFQFYKFEEHMLKLVQKKIIEKIEKLVVVDTILRESWLEQQRKLFAQLYDVCETFDFEYDHSEQIKVSDFLKMLQFKPMLDGIYTPVDFLKQLFALNNQFNLYDSILLVDCKKYLSEYERSYIYEQAIFLKQTVILFESSLEQQPYLFERKLSIFEDFTSQKQ